MIYSDDRTLATLVAEARQVGGIRYPALSYTDWALLPPEWQSACDEALLTYDRYRSQRGGWRVADDTWRHRDPPPLAWVVEALRRGASALRQRGIQPPTPLSVEESVLAVVERGGVGARAMGRWAGLLLAASGVEVEPAAVDAAVRDLLAAGVIVLGPEPDPHGWTHGAPRRVYLRAATAEAAR